MNTRIKGEVNVTLTAEEALFLCALLNAPMHEYEEVARRFVYSLDANKAPRTHDMYEAVNGFDNTELWKKLNDRAKACLFKVATLGSVPHGHLVRIGDNDKQVVKIQPNLYLFEEDVSWVVTMDGALESWSNEEGVTDLGHVKPHSLEVE